MEVRINNLTYILADLQGKVKSAEQEKESLITAMRLLVEDSNNEPNATIKNYTDETSKQSETQDSADCAGQTKEVLNPNIQVSNRFSNLNIEESNADDVDVTQNDLVTARTEPATKPKQVNEKYNRRHHNGSKETKQTYHHPRPNVAIVGDSMLKHLNPTQLRRSTRSFNTQIKTFPNLASQGLYTSARAGKDPGWSWSRETPEIYCLREPEGERESIKLHVST